MIGILSCLDEECIMPKATDLTFTRKLDHMWSGPVDDEEDYHAGRDKYEPHPFRARLRHPHYAAKSNTAQMAGSRRTRTPLNDNLTKVLAASSEPYVATLFAEYAESHSGTRSNFASLMGQLRATQPHFVRCIVPNTLKKPGRVDVPLILDQLRCNGVLEGIRIARLGYPNRLPFVEFRQRYEILTTRNHPRGYMDGREACRRMVNGARAGRHDLPYRHLQDLFKAGVLAELEERRDALLYDIFSGFQATCRMWVVRRQTKKILNRANAVRTIQRNARVYGELKDWPWWQLYTKVRPLLAATRNDEELRKREAELQLAEERAERERQAKEALETLKMTLEAGQTACGR
ncbi:P-loop containing nucleoside triphosphate hydrolase protein [Coprinopsis sp. MPI-PUGE-AT-0042]|nr:P-loop containing nucleoside triphosphate hydrolase protein [Coprinopsis sp. MPI-PUGE-AT-0042]